MRFRRMENRQYLMMKIVGLILIALLVLFLINDMLMRSYTESHATRTIDVMQKKENINGFENLEEFESYLENAIEKQDLDSYLRACAIDEKTDCYPFTYMMGQYSKNKFSYKAAYLPSGSYKEYQPINSMIYINEFKQQFDELMEQLMQQTKKTNPKIKIDGIKILMPEQQVERNYMKALLEKSKRWDASYMVELYATADVEGKKYVFGITVAKYDKYYKIFKLQANLLGWSSDIYAMNKKEIASETLISNVKTKDFMSEFESMIIKGNNIYEVNKKENTIDNSQNVILPLNYYIIDQEYGKTPEDTIELFLIELFRCNMKKALNYCYISEENNSLEDLITLQGDYALQLSYMIKGLSGLPYSVTVDVKYSYLDFPLTGIVTMLNPEGIHTTEILQIQETSFENEYYAELLYNKIWNRIGFTIKKTDKGYCISSISAYKNGFSKGEVLGLRE